MSTVIELRGVGKLYQQLEERRLKLKSLLPFAPKDRRDLWALRDINVSVERGELVGILGHNGAGKTTLLQLLAGVTAPTEGRLRVIGRVAPLITLGVGFHAEMTGRENVLINAMLLGLTAREVRGRIDEIMEFAELGEFIDTPVKFYSSGMILRLGFSVVIHIDPTVLLVDEILAVGDAAFQLKCFNRLRQFRDDGAAILVVSHAIHTVRQLCPRAILVRKGRVIYDGDVEHAIAMHYESISGQELSQGGLAVEVVSQCLVGAEGEDHHANYDEPLTLELHLRFHRDVPEAQCWFAIRTDGGDVITRVVSGLDPGGGGFTRNDELRLRIDFRARLGAGNYRLAVEFRDAAQQTLGSCDGLVLFVSGRPSSLGVVDLRAQIEVDGTDRTDRRLTLLDGGSHPPT